MKRNHCIALMVVFLLAAVIFIGMGFDKIYSYENPEDSWREHKNAYVGGDAYNYIINGTYATAYFVLGSSLGLAALLTLIAYYASSILMAIRPDDLASPDRDEADKRAKEVLEKLQPVEQEEDKRERLATVMKPLDDTPKCARCGKTGKRLWLSKSGYCIACAEAVRVENEQDQQSEEAQHE